MGAIGKVIGAPVKAATSLVNPILSPFGLGGEQGDYYQPTLGNQALMDYQNAVKSFDPTAATQQSTSDVQNNAILGKIFGQGGLQDQTLGDLSKARKEEADLAARGYSLQPEDFEAYGQTSGNIARLFGQQEQDLAQSLANRGLASGPSGIAGASFTGLQGNKNEQLAKAQTDIAQKRMQTNMQRLSDTRNFMNQLSGQSLAQGQFGNQAISDQYNRKRDKIDDLGKVAGMNMQQQQSDNQNRLASLQSKSENAGQTIFDAVGRGLFKGVEGGVQKGIGGKTGGLFG